ncbi:MAG: hypothetical protein K0R57_419 [Paenibacillaceae bacterium]|jgi:biotin carboxyl carrier protein|nr:hypothetical protein [Paenibacillaceae bacterium]
MQHQTLFRDKPLAAAASPELLDQQAAIVRPGAWILLAALLSSVAAAGFWAWTGNLSGGVKGNGIIFPSTGVQAIFTQGTGFVENVLVREGDFVEQGQILLVIPNEELLTKLAARVQTGSGPEGDAPKENRPEEEAPKENRPGEEAPKENGPRSDARQEAGPGETWETLSEQYERTSVIRAPVSGTVQSVAAAGSLTEPGQRVAHIIPEDRLTNSKEVVAFVPFSISKKIRPGMEAQVSPAYAPREEYGYMRGYVSKVASIPSTGEMLQKTFGDNGYARSLFTDENPAEVRIMLHMDASSKNSFQWSNKKGEELTVETSTVCEVQIVTDTKRPIDLLLQFRK